MRSEILLTGRNLVLFLLLFIHSVSGQETGPSLSIQREGSHSVSLWWSDLFPNYVIERSDGLGEWQVPLASHQEVFNNLEYLESIRSPRAFFRLRPQETGGPVGGFNFLIAAQRERGLWTMEEVDSIPATIGVLEVLSGQSLNSKGLSKSLNLASVGLQDLRPTNHDELARLIIALSTLSIPADQFVTQLLEGQNEVSPGTHPYARKGGWGLLPGFSDSNLETALSLRALHAAEAPLGAAVASLPVPAAGDSEAVSFLVPEGASNLILFVEEASAPFQIRFTRPNLSESFVNVTPGGVPVDVTLGNASPGQWSIRARGTGTAGAISFQVGFLTSGGVDTSRSAGALGALLTRQNPDGGWGITGGQDSHLFSTFEVVETLARLSPESAVALAAAASWVEKNLGTDDGGFAEGESTSNAFETAMGALILKHSDEVHPRLAQARSRLRELQLPNGSWESDPRITALALSALLSPPKVLTIPSQTVTDPDAFNPINLALFVDDPIYSDGEMIWQVVGDSEILVDIDNGIATMRYNVNDFTGSTLAPLTETLVDEMTFIVTNPDGLSDRVDVTFTVNPGGGGGETQLARGGSLSGTATVTGAEAVIDQIVQFSLGINPQPNGVSYLANSVSRTDATTIEVAWEISAAADAPLGQAEFAVTHNFFDAGSNPVNGLSGAILQFNLEITP